MNEQFDENGKRRPSFHIAYCFDDPNSEGSDLSTSVGAGNKPGYPSQDVLDRLHNGGSQIYRTDQAGSVEITAEKDRFWVQSER